MATDTRSKAQETQRPGTDGYEARDASVPWIFGVVLFLICSGIVIQAGLAGALRHLVRGPAPSDAWSPGARATHSAQPGTFPKLQISGPLDLGRFRTAEDVQLTNYGWINRTSGIVRVPIERAMDLVLRKGLPTNTNAANAAGQSPAQLMEQRAQQWRNGDHQ